MSNKCERRKKPLSTFDELLKDYGIEFTDEPDPEGAYIPLVDDDGNIVKLRLDTISLEDIL